MSITKNRVTGAWDISDTKFNRLIHMTYMGYTKREAAQLFREYLKLLKE